MVGSSTWVPEWVFRGDKFHGRGNEGARGADRKKIIDDAEIAGYVDRDEEEISFIRVKGVNLAC